MTLARFSLISFALLLVLALSIGGTLELQSRFLKPDSSTPPPQAAKPLLFAQMQDIIASIPDDTGDPASSFVQFSIQFQTTNQQAVDAFNNLQPIIKSQIINLLMGETGKSLQNPGERAALAQKCLVLSNGVLASNGALGKVPPFTAAYITNLVVQE